MQTINFQELGDGQPLIVLHGLFGTLDNLKTVARQLSETYRVFLVDLPAHGGSDTPSPLNLATMADALEAFIKAQELSNVAILGHSLGGKVAMELALSSPDLISKLIVADIAPVAYERRHDSIIDGLKSVPLTNTTRQEADQSLAKEIEETGVRSFLMKSFARDGENWQWKFDLDSLAQSYDNLIKGNRQGVFDKPTLFIIGGNSNYVLPQHSEEITARFPKVAPKVIQGTGHWLHAEKPSAFVKICRDFLAQ